VYTYIIFCINKSIRHLSKQTATNNYLTNSGSTVQWCIPRLLNPISEWEGRELCLFDESACIDVCMSVCTFVDV